ncbi:MAG: hypothetical protein K2Q18_03025 [Bdellovibrionales bacterium]|nr:hypothetical protein [Bdellovibrionales bacterium]
MCLICVEYNLKRMTRDEMKKALPEMVMFAKTEEDRAHFKKLQSLGDSSSESSEQTLQDFISEHISKYGTKTR